MKRSICIHGHFYQPPRENPWLEEIELQDTAYPYHDWNERISAECYGPNAASRILDGDKKIIGIINNYASISFNFGPTLLSWMERHDSGTYRQVIEADALSRERFSGHGSAIAQCYNHMIMPLSNGRDRITQIVWGKKDFVHRFGREPEGMWLPETAVDTETLELLARYGMRFTILSPFQARGVRRLGEESWTNVEGGKIDPKVPYVFRLPSGGQIVLFFYDGPISHDLGFGRLLDDGKNFAGRLEQAFRKRPKANELVHVATDGETYGHHHRHGEMALAYCLHHIEKEKLTDLTVYGEFLEQNPPAHEVQIVDQSAWSCAHGVGRWWTNCGCSTGMHQGWNQEWRTPLRNSLDWLRDTIAPMYEREASSLLKDPWEARNGYIDVLLDRTGPSLDSYFGHHEAHPLDGGERTKALRLLETQRHALLMYTSCGWFFDDISGIETVQVLQYASRAMQLVRETLGADLEPEFIRRLSEAKSNLPRFGNGERVYELFVKPAQIDLLRVGIHHAISSLFESYSERTKIYRYEAERVSYERLEAGRLKLAIGRTKVFSELFGERSLVSFAILHMGDHNLNGGGREFMGNEAFEAMASELKEAFSRSDVPEVIRLMDKHFGVNTYSLGQLFRDEKRRVLELILEPTVGEIERALHQIYDAHYPLMQAMEGMSYPMPRAFAVAGAYVSNAKLRDLLGNESSSETEIERVVEDIGKFEFQVDGDLLGFVGTKRVNSLMASLEKHPSNAAILEKTAQTLSILGGIPVELNLWIAQNVYYRMCRQMRGDMERRSREGDGEAARWVAAFDRLGDLLSVRCA